LDEAVKRWKYAPSSSSNGPSHSDREFFNLASIDPSRCALKGFFIVAAPTTRASTDRFEDRHSPAVKLVTIPILTTA
jgi:hypothetical protein